MPQETSQKSKNRRKNCMDISYNEFFLAGKSKKLRKK